MQILYPQFESGCRLFISKRNKQCIPLKMPVFERMALRVKRYRGLELVSKAVAKFYAAEALSRQVAQNIHSYSMMTKATYWQA